VVVVTCTVVVFTCFVRCGCVYVWVLYCVLVLVICVLVFTFFVLFVLCSLYCFVYVYEGALFGAWCSFFICKRFITILKLMLCSVWPLAPKEDNLYFLKRGTVLRMSEI
jgi:hypothetical protein